MVYWNVACLTSTGCGTGWKANIIPEGLSRGVITEMARIRRIAIVGSSGHARVAIDIAERDPGIRIAGLLDSFRKPGEIEAGYAILGSEKDLPDLMRKFEIDGGFVAIGDNWQRYLMAERIRKLSPNLEFVTLIHPSVIVAKGVRISAGSVLMPGVTVNSSSVIGEFCIINTNASLDHDSRMEAYSSLGPAVATGGRVTLERFSAVAIGGVVSNGVVIGEHSIVGAGAVALRDIPRCSVAFGIPAVVSRTREIGERYL